MRIFASIHSLLVILGMLETQLSAREHAQRDGLCRNDEHSPRNAGPLKPGAVEESHEEESRKNGQT